MRGPSKGCQTDGKDAIRQSLKGKKHHPLEGAGIRIFCFGTLKNWCMVSDLGHYVLMIIGGFNFFWKIFQCSKKKTLGMLVHLEEPKQNHQNAEWPGEPIKIERYMLVIFQNHQEASF